MIDLGRVGGPSWTRLLASGAAATVAAALTIRARVAGDVAKPAGDALYTVLIYALVVLAAPRLKAVTVGGIALGISWVVEFSQLSGLPMELSQRSVMARLVLGTTFDPPDLFWYVVGAASGWLVHTAWGFPKTRPVRLPR
jgi:hypothetical protein